MIKKIIFILFFLYPNKFLYAKGCADSFLWKDCIDNSLKWTTKPLDVAASNYLEYILSFLAVVMLIYWLYWWFLMLTAWSDEERFGKWKKILISILIWVAIIFLAWPIVEFFLARVFK